MEYEKLAGDRLGEKSEDIRARVERAREVQQRRFEGIALHCNGGHGAG